MQNILNMKKLPVLVAAALTLSTGAFAQCGKNKKMADKVQKNSASKAPVMKMNSKTAITGAATANAMTMDSKPTASSPAKAPATIIKSKPATVKSGKAKVIKKDMSMNHTAKAVKSEKAGMKAGMTAMKKGCEAMCGSGMMDEMQMSKSK